MSALGASTRGSASLGELVDYLAELLETAIWDDYGPNGLQVEGRPVISTLATGVSACGELFERSKRLGADAILVHHGLFWDNLSPVLTGIQRRRVASLIEADLSLLAYHLPLDAHPLYGNNALAIRALGLGDLEPFGATSGRTIGYGARYDSPLAASEFFDRCARVFDQEPLVLGKGPRDITTVAVVSGGGQSLLHEALVSGIDAFVTGEASEWVTNLAREGGIHYVAAGHHATERFGVRALGEHLAGRFGLSATFIDVPNPV